MTGVGLDQSFDHLSDSQLVACFYQCQEAAFEALARRWWGRLFSFFVRWGYSAESAEDLAQEAVVRVYGTKERLTFDSGKPFGPFMMGIAMKLARARWSSEGPDRVAWLEEMPELLQPGGLDGRTLRDIWQCVSALPEAERTYISLCAKHGVGEFSHGDIAEILEKWPSKVTQISRQARARLRECLEGKGHR